MSANEWSDLIAEYSHMKPQVIPKEYKSSKDIADEFNMAGRTANTKIKEMSQDGRIEMRKFRIQRGTKVCLIPHYKIIKK
jgi:Mn-dependent DtxR family transcriptional regulator